MKTFLECVPCFVRQAFEGGEMATDDIHIREEILREVMREAAGFDFSLTPPHMAMRTHRIIKRLAENEDPYKELKHHYNQLGLSMTKDLRQKIYKSADPFETAVRLAIAGNIIDFGVQISGHVIDLEKTVEEAMHIPFAKDDLAKLKDSVARASNILYVADNSGEIALDKLFIELLAKDAHVTVAVRGKPIINDVTMCDAVEVGLTEMPNVTVMENGSDAPGTILEDCTEAMRDEFYNADTVICKGQGNYETLSQSDRDDVFFLLKAKCPVIARDMSCDIGGLIVKKLEY